MGEALDRFLAVPLWQRLVLQAILMVGLGAGWYFLYYEGLDGVIAKEKRTTQTLNQREGKAQSAQSNAEAIKTRITEVESELDGMRRRLPADAELGELLQKIHGQAKIVGLEISRFERQVSVNEGHYVRIPVKMTLEGTFPHIATFFYYVGNLTRIVNVENIQLTIRKRQRSSTLLQATCTATTFMYQPPAGLEEQL